MTLIQEGPRDAKIVIVGEAPGRQEMARGKPFVGGSGDLLNKMLGNVGIARSRVFITNVCHKQPPGNDFTWFLKPKIRPDYILGVIQLKQDLEEIKPNIAVCMGAQALRVLTGKSQIGKWRGSLLPSTLVPGLKVIGTWHPAFILRDNYDYKAVVEFDLQRMVEESTTAELKYPERELITAPSDYDLHQLVKELGTAEWLAVDIECFDTPEGWKLACVGFSDRPNRAVVIPVDSATRQAAISTLLACPAKKIFQNGFNFDIPVLLENGYKTENYAWDTMVGMHVIYTECASSSEETQALTGKKKPTQPALRKGLAFQTSIFTKEPYYKDDGKLWRETGDLDLFWQYNGRDVAVTREIKDRQAEGIAEMGVESVMEHETAMLPCLMDMTRRGILIDKVAHKELKDKYTREIMNLQDFLDAGAGKSVNVKSNPDMKWLLFEKLSMPITKRSTKTQNPSADKDVINKLAEKHQHPLLMAILEIRERRDLIERYLDVAYDTDGKMRCAWDPTGTRTGRLASRVSIHGTGTNLQNQPKELRRMYVAEPGKVLFSIDYSQAEARVVAWLARCEGLIDLFSDPTRDVHKENAARFYKIEVVVVDGKMRYVAKRIIHASNYGMGPEKCMRVINNDYRDTGIRVSFNEARLGQEAYFFTYPEIQNVFWHEVRQELNRSLILVSPTIGRKRMFFGRWSDKFLNEAYSYIPQSTVGDMTNKAMVQVHERCPEAQLLVNGHDSLIGQCDADRIEEVTNKVQALMRIPIIIHGRELVIPTEVEVGLNWGEQSEDNPGGLRSLEAWLAQADS